MGDHVKQAGSLVAPDRLRFDFTHFEATTPDQIKEVEKLANEKIMLAYNVDTYNTTLKDARENGVTALFGEKYGEEVRVINVGDFSLELCGGCHVDNTAEIGLVKVTNESSVGANARRIEACTSFEAYNYCNSFIDQINEAAKLLKTSNKQVVQGIDRALQKSKKLIKELEEAYSKSTSDRIANLFENSIIAKGGYTFVKVFIEDFGNYDVKEI